MTLLIDFIPHNRNLFEINSGELVILILSNTTAVNLVHKSESVIFDFDFMKKFSGILRKMIAQDSKFGIALGGGYMMRKLRDIAKEAGISEAVFDRSGFRYHGRIKAVADGLRKGGLKM